MTGSEQIMGNLYVGGFMVLALMGSMALVFSVSLFIEAAFSFWRGRRGWPHARRRPRDPKRLD